MNYNKHHFIRAFVLFTGTGRFFHNERLAIDRLDYPDGYALHVFDLSPDLTGDEKFEQLRTGSVRLQLKFAEEVADPITLIIYTEYQNLIENDRNRNVIYDFMALDNSRQIDRIIIWQWHVRKFDGVYSSNNLLQHDRPKLLVASTNPSSSRRTLDSNIC